MSADEGPLLERVRAVVGGAAAALGHSASRIDDLNVYPVPDGDTGTNLSRTLAAVVDAVDTREPEPPAALAHAVSRAALMGARGNSGIILSQVVRGLCDSLGAADRLDGAAAAAALRSASDAAYRAIRQPVEGTMLTVVREMAEGAERAAVAGGDADVVLAAALAQGEDALERTPTMLDVLREAGVVDAGGAGLVEILRGALAALRNEEPELPVAPAHGPTVEALHSEYSSFRYCTSFLVEGPDVDADRLEEELAGLGDSLVVVGDGQAVKIHVHTDEPGRAIAAATAMGVIEGVEIANMHAQSAERTERLAAPARRALSLVPDLPPDAEPDRACDVVCVVAGEGNRAIAASFGARAIVEGGQTMNPSTQELLDAIEGCAAREVVVLPNNANVVLAAEHAVGSTSRAAKLVPTRSIQSGLAALVAYRPELGAAENAEAMAAAAAQVRTGEVTEAVRDATADGVKVRKGEYLALVDGRVVASSPDGSSALGTVTAHLLGDGGEILTVLRGDAAAVARLGLDEALVTLAAANPDLEIEVHDGGQPHYPVLLSIE